MKITKLGHCCLLIEINGVRFLTDPGNYTTLQNEIKNIDAVVISHEHTDHLHIESVKAILENNPEAIIISNGSAGKILEKENISYVKIADGEEYKINGVVISGHGQKHAPIYQDYEQIENTGYFFDLPELGKNLFYPGDAFTKLDQAIDILAFPIAGPWLNIEQAMDYVLETKPRVAIPVHDGGLTKNTGIVKRLPKLYFPKNNIKYVFLEINKEVEL
jgi:L-ascorbate metabolism protein UlaG (beta-lactamase superfamily)